VQELLTRHYDPMYAQSIERNFKQYAQALPLELPDRTPASFAEIAATLIARASTAPLN
jgi:tRNA 2-selenouridine synthase